MEGWDAPSFYAEEVVVRRREKRRRGGVGRF